MIVAGIPTRGLIFGKTIEGVLSNEPDKIIISDRRPIPDCFNYLVDKAIGLGADLWLVEEDMIIPPGTLDKLVDLDADIATADYLLPKGRSVVNRHPSGYIYGGTGCTLITNEVLEELGHFRTDIEWSAGELKYWKHNKKNVYGKHDVDYYMRAQFDNFVVKVLSEPVGHMKLKKRGDDRTNDGTHEIEELWTT